MYIDAHCHLEVDTYGDQVDAVIERAVGAGLTHLVAVGASGVARGAREVVELAARQPRVFAAVGIHPHDAAQVTDADCDQIEELLAHDRVVCLGEIGLDYYYDNSPRKEQQAVFRRLLKMACVHDYPVMIHVRDAHEDCYAILDEVGIPKRGGVIHCFSAGPAEAEHYLNRGLHLSIPGIVTFKNAEPLREAVRNMPLDRMFLETDCPYLAPVPFRGKRNEPAYLVHTAEAVGALRGVPSEEISRATHSNTVRFFGLPADPIG